MTDKGPFDDLLPPDHAAGTPGPFDDILKAPPAPENSLVGNLARTAAGSAVSGVGDIVSGLGETARQLARPVVAGINALGGNLSEPVNPLSNSIINPAGAIQSKGEQISASASPEFRREMAQTEVLHPSTWTPQGVLGNVASFAGGVAPLVAANLTPAGPEIDEAKLASMAPSAIEALNKAKTLRQLAYNAGLFGAQSGGGAMNAERERIMEMPDADLAKVPLYQQLIANGTDPAAARSQVAEKSAQGVFLPAAGVGTLGGLALGGPLAHGVQEAAGKAIGGGLAKKVAVGAGVDATLMGAQNVAAQAATVNAANAITGENRDPLQNFGALFASGALSGLPFGAYGGMKAHEQSEYASALKRQAQRDADEQAAAQAAQESARAAQESRQQVGPADQTFYREGSPKDWWNFAHTDEGRGYMDVVLRNKVDNAPDATARAKAQNNLDRWNQYSAWAEDNGLMSKRPQPELEQFPSLPAPGGLETEQPSPVAREAQTPVQEASDHIDATGGPQGPLARVVQAAAAGERAAEPEAPVEPVAAPAPAQELAGVSPSEAQPTTENENVQVQGRNEGRPAANPQPGADEQQANGGRPAAAQVADEQRDGQAAQDERAASGQRVLLNQQAATQPVEPPAPPSAAPAPLVEGRDYIPARTTTGDVAQPPPTGAEQAQRPASTQAQSDAVRARATARIDELRSKGRRSFNQNNELHYLLQAGGDVDKLRDTMAQFNTPEPASAPAKPQTEPSEIAPIQEKSNAEEIRKDQGQTGGEGRPGTKGETGGRGNLQQPARTHAEASHAVQPVAEAKQERPPATAAAAPAAQHVEPGKPAEAASAAVVEQSIQKGQAKTPLDPVQAREKLLREIDVATQKANKNPWVIDKRNGRRYVGVLEGQSAAPDVGFVTFDVPGDGKFKVVNNAGALRDFRDKVARSAGFKKPPKDTFRNPQAAPADPFTVIKQFANDSENRNALEFAKMKGIPTDFGVDNNNQPILYALTKAIQVGERDTFVGRRASGKDAGKWAVVDRATGKQIGRDAASAEQAVENANTRMASPEAAKAKGRIAEQEAQAMPVAEREAAWLRRDVAPDETVGSANETVRPAQPVKRPADLATKPSDDGAEQQRRSAFSQPIEKRTGPAHTLATLARSVANMRGTFGEAAPEVKLVRSGEELPESAKKLDPEGYADAEGFYDDTSGTVYLVADNIKAGYDPTLKRNVDRDERARQVLGHEVIGHVGIEHVVGPELWGQIEDRLDRMRDSGKHDALFDEIDQRYRGANRSIGAREAVAVMAEKGVRNSIMDRIFAAVRRFLRKIGMVGTVTENDLRQYIVKAARYIRDGVRPRESAASQAGFSRPYGDTADEFRAHEEAAGKAKEPPPAAAGTGGAPPPPEPPPRSPGESPEAAKERAAATAAPNYARLVREAALKLRDLGRGVLREAWARQSLALNRADLALGKFRDYFDKRPKDVRDDPLKSYASVMDYEAGRQVNDPTERAFLDTMATLLANQAEQIRQFGDDKLSVLLNYFPHLWADHAKAERMYATLMGKRPLAGSKNFTKQRVFRFLSEGLESGLKPAYDNPADAIMERYAAGERYLMALRVKQQLEKLGQVIKIRAGQRVPDGFSRVNDRAFQSAHVWIKQGEPPTDFPETFPGAEGVPAEAGVSYWDHVVPDLVARDINNYLAPGLNQYQGWRNFRWLQNIMLTARLGLSAFHAGFTTVDSAVFHLDMALGRLAHGDVLGTLHSLGRALASPILSPLEGRKFYQQFLGLREADPNTQAVLGALLKGGARAKMDPTDWNNALDKFRRAWNRKEGKFIASHAIGAAAELGSYLITHKLVPYQKMTARVLMMKRELDARAEVLGQNKGDYAAIVNALDENALRKIAGDVVQQVDDRLGQVAYDNLFLNRTVKDIAQATIQAVGWNIGTGRTIFGGFADIRRVFKPEMLNVPLDMAGKITDAHMGRVTGRLSYLIALNVGVGLLGAMTQQMLTGQGPQELKDYFFPKTGRTNPDGSPERISFPGYLKDEYALTTHPLMTAEHKLHPFFSTTAELLNNEDFYGTQIHDPNDPWETQAEDIAKHIAGAFVPYSIQNTLKNQQAGQSSLMTAAPFFGVTPAPASIARSDFQQYLAQKAADAAPQGARSKEQARQTAAIHDAERQLRLGEQPDLSQFSPEQRRSIAKAAREDVTSIRFKRMSLTDKLNAYDVASNDEKQKYNLRRLILNSHWQAGLQALPPESRQAARDRLAAIRQ